MSNPVENLTASLPSWGAKLAFGERTTIGGQEVIPAALVVFGFGGGGGSGKWPEGGAVRGSGRRQRRWRRRLRPADRRICGRSGRPEVPAQPGRTDHRRVPLISAAGWAIARIISAVKMATD